MTNQWEQLLAVQTVDTTIQQLDHRRRQLPERVALEEIEAKLDENRAHVVEQEAAKAELVKAQKKLEDEIADIEAKIEHDNELLYAGSSDPSVLQSLQHEIETRKQRISSLEDDELELMEQVEPIDARLATLADERAALDEQAARATVALANVESEIVSDRSAAVAERASLIEGVDPDAVPDADVLAVAQEFLAAELLARAEGDDTASPLYYHKGWPPIYRGFPSLSL